MAPPYIWEKHEFTILSPYIDVMFGGLSQSIKNR
jgi:hypothetical protein